MTTDRPIDASSPAPESETNEDASAQATGWLAAIRAHLGLAESPTLRDALEVALKDDPNASSAFSAEERAMLRRLLRFGNCRVEDVMVPRADIIALDDSDSIQHLLTTFEEAGVSRVPVFSGTLDDPHGMIHIKDLFRWLLEDAARNGVQNKLGANGAKASARPAKGAAKKHRNGAGAPNENSAPVSEASIEKDKHPGSAQLNLTTVDLSRPIAVMKIKRPLLFVPPSMPAMNLLIRMQATRNHMALVIDEYGGTDGLITIEDLVEQIVGDIEDEHDDAEVAHIIHDPKLGLLASARTPLEELESHLNRKLLSPEQEEEIDTLGGLVFTIVGRVPARGEIVRHPTGIEFEVLDADARRVKALKVHVPENVEPLDEAQDAEQAEDRN